MTIQRMACPRDLNKMVLVNLLKLQIQSHRWAMTSRVQWCAL